MLRDPVASGQPCVEDAVGNITRHFLRANEHAIDFGIIDSRQIGARAGVNIETGAREKLDGRRFERAFWNAEFEFHFSG